MCRQCWGFQALNWAINHTPSDNDTPRQKEMYERIQRIAAESIENMFNPDGSVKANGA